MADNDLINDVGMLKGQVSALMTIATKMDVIIDKLVDQHDRHISKVYDDMDNRRLETEADIKEIHDRIDMVLEKVQDSEKSVLEEIQSLKKAMSTHSESSRAQFEKLNQWKWMIAGGIVVISWLFSHLNPDTIHLFK